MCDEYWELVKQLWQDRDVVIVAGPSKSFVKQATDYLDNAKSLNFIMAPVREAYSVIDDLEQQAYKFPKSSLFILQVGPTATVLAYRMACKGYQALDLGHVSMFYRRYMSNKSKN